MDSAAPERSLAHANLLRVRGQRDEAKRALLAFLAERPNDRDALDLLARTCDDAGETEEANRWRGLACGAPPSPIRAESPTTIEGLFPKNPTVAGIAVLGIGILVIGLGFAIGRSSAPREPLPVLQGRVEAPGTTASTGGPVAVPVEETAGATIATNASTIPTPSVTETARGESRTEANGLARLTAAEGAGARTLVVTHDPRTDAVTVTFAPRGGESLRRETASLARTALATFTTAKTLQLRALRGRELVFLATATRDRFATVETETWVRENESNPDALADALLTNEWTASTSAESPDAKPTAAP